MKRSKAREVALQLLYQHDLNKIVPREVIEQFVRDRLTDPDAALFCLGLYDGVTSEQAEIDRKLEMAATNWKLHRMTVVDRNVLRLGAYELLHGTEVGIAIDEAIKLAQRFGGANSGAFVNGVLDRVRQG
jgi:N utilization substance protein B